MKHLRSLTLVVAALLCVFAWVGCGDSGTKTTDTGQKIDGGKADAPKTVDGTPPPPTDGAPPPTDGGQPGTLLLKGKNGEPANYSCLGKWSDPNPPGSEQTIAGQVTEFGTLPKPSAGATVDVFSIADLPGPTTPPTATTTSAADGKYTVKVPGDRYRLSWKISKDKAYTTWEFALPLDLDQELYTVPESTVAVIAALLGETITPPDAAIMAGNVVDCDGDVVKLAKVTVEGAAGAKVFYFKNGLPVTNDKQSATDADGRFAILNVPPGSTATVSVIGAPVLGAPDQVVGKMSVPGYSKSVVIGAVQPLQKP